MLSVAARSQESSSYRVLLPAPEIQGTSSLAPNFRVATFPFETMDADHSALTVGIAVGYSGERRLAD